MHNLIPPFIHRQFQANRRQGSFAAASLFVDISGFTHLTETLMQHRKDGAEVLTGALNHVFQPVVRSVYAHGGMITTFAGDAFTALFPLRRQKAVLHAVQTAFTIQRFFAQESTIRTRYGDFTLGAKVGLGMGQVRWGILGRDHNHAYFFGGPAVEACINAERAAAAGEVLATEELVALVERGVVDTTARGRYQGVVGLHQEVPAGRPRVPQLDHTALLPFVQDEAIAVTENDIVAEFREVVPAFISFGDLNAQELDRFVTTVMSLANSYGGYFNKLDFGDKGGLMLLLFGAPVAHENDLARAADFFAALRAETRGVPWRAGLTSGTAYAGLIGGEEQGEYTAIGDTVNLAARLMQGAAWGEVWTGGRAAGQMQKSYVLEPLGELSFKGKSGALAVHRLTSRKIQTEGSLHVGTMVGRQAELGRLLDFVQPVLHGHFAGVAYIYGEAGMGKSRLVYELQQNVRRQAAEQEREILWLICPVDETLRQSLNPFKHVLRQYFDQANERTEGQKQASFDKAVAALIAGLGGSAAPSAPMLIQELDRLRPFLAALVDLRPDDPLYERMDPKLRYENSLVAFKTLIQAESLRQPVILQIEDLHWLDNDSQGFIRTQARGLTGYPIALICTSRPADDGSRPKLPVEAEVPQLSIELRTLAPEGVQLFAEQVLGGPADQNVGRFLLEKTAGNPFFVEQLALDLRERGVLQWREQRWELTGSGAVELPTTINAVLVARLDRLAVQVRQVVQTAAVLGFEFEIQVLSAMLQSLRSESEAEIHAKVEQAAAGMIWSSLNEIRYIFRHALLRDAAYEMQLRSHLRELHRLAGQAIESIYAHGSPAGTAAPSTSQDEPRPGLELHYADLAYHYAQAQDRERERRYSRLAGKSAAARFANVEAIRYLSRALELTPAGSMKERYELLLGRETVYDLQGQREFQQQDLATLESLAAALGDDRRRCVVALRQSLYNLVTGNYPVTIEAAQRAISLAQRTGETNQEAAGYLAWGRALGRQGKHVEAGPYHERSLELARSLQDTKMEGENLYYLAAIPLHSGDMAKARAYYEQALECFRQSGNRLGEGMALSALGGLALNEEDFPTAHRYMEQCLDTCREMGERRTESLVMNNLGMVLIAEGEYSQARKLYDQIMQIKREIGDREGQAFALIRLGFVVDYYGQYAEAEAQAQEALRISREINYINGEGMVLGNQSLVAYHQGQYERSLECARGALRIHEELGIRTECITPALQAGRALAKLGRAEEAVQSYREALALCQEFQDTTSAVDVRAAWATLCLEAHDLAQALAHVEEILKYLQVRLPNGFCDPLGVLLSCYQVLNIAGDPRAAGVLERAWTLLQQQAAAMPDEEWRRSFLEDVAVNREIQKEWRKRG